MTDKVAGKGQRVKVHYKGTFEDGEVFDSSEGRDPLNFQIGAGEVIKGFEDAVTGMKVGEKKTITLQPDEAYGQRDERLVQEVPKEALGDKIEPKEGLMLTIRTPEGHSMMAKITKIADDKVTFDLNPPLAGKTLVFELELAEIVK